jgi:hypothetical protein
MRVLSDEQIQLKHRFLASQTLSSTDLAFFFLPENSKNVFALGIWQKRAIKSK